MYTNLLVGNVYIQYISIIYVLYVIYVYVVYKKNLVYNTDAKFFEYIYKYIYTKNFLQNKSQIIDPLTHPNTRFNSVTTLLSMLSLT